MAVERKFIKEAVQKVKIDRYVRKELQRVGVGDVIIKRTPLGTRIVVEAVKPGLVIGRKGKNIQTLTETIKGRFKIENPQLEVGDVPVPEFNAGIMAKQLAQTLEARVHFRRACHDMLQRIMRAGALGAMIVVTGKISGARARSEKFKTGYIRYCGEPAAIYVRQATAQANLKPGIIGVKVKIMPPIENPIDELGLKSAKPAESRKAPDVSLVRVKSRERMRPQRRARRKRETK